MTGSGPVFISADVARAVFDWSDAIAALRDAYVQAQLPATVPPRSIASDGHAWLRVLPAMPVTGRYFGAKLMGSPGSSTPPQVEFVIVLFDRTTAKIAALLDGNVITGLRTAATSAVALDRLAKHGPIRLALIGSGFEATMHTRAAAAVRTLADVAVYSPNPQRRRAFADAMTAELGVTVVPVDTPAAAVENADVVIAAARSHGEVPILYGEWLAPRATIVSIGSTVPSQREIDVSVVDRSDVIICDVLHEVIDATGDMIAARNAGVEFSHKAHGLTDLLNGRCDSRLATAGNTLFKSVGSGLQDIVVAALILTRALAAGLATPLPISFETKE